MACSMLSTRWNVAPTWRAKAVAMVVFPTADRPPIATNTGRRSRSTSITVQESHRALLSDLDEWLEMCQDASPASGTEGNP